MKKSRRAIIWGAVLLAAALMLIASQTTTFATINAFTIIITVLLAYILVESVLYRDFVLVVLALAALYLMYNTPLGLPPVTAWYMLLAALVAGLGLMLMFRRRPPRRLGIPNRLPDKMKAFQDDNLPMVGINLRGGRLALHPDAMKSGLFVAFFGALTLDMEAAVLENNRSEIFVDCFCSSVKLLVPKDWRVIDNLDITLGSASNQVAFSTADDDSPTLIVSGRVCFGRVKIQYTENQYAEAYVEEAEQKIEQIEE